MAVAPRRASRRRYVLLIIVLTAITLITLDTRNGRSGPIGALGRGAHSVVGPVESAINNVARPISDWWQGVFDSGDIKKENRKLRQQNQELQGQQRQAQAAITENENLKKLLGFAHVARRPDRQRTHRRPRSRQLRFHADDRQGHERRHREGHARDRARQVARRQRHRSRRALRKDSRGHRSRVRGRREVSRAPAVRFGDGHRAGSDRSGRDARQRRRRAGEGVERRRRVDVTVGGELVPARHPGRSRHARRGASRWVAAARVRQAVRRPRRARIRRRVALGCKGQGAVVRTTTTTTTSTTTTTTVPGAVRCPHRRRHRPTFAGP